MVATCEICGQEGANQYRSQIEDGTEGSWYHILCLLNKGVASESETLRWTKHKAIGYLAGLIDGEGHVRQRDGGIEITNNDVRIIAAVKTAAEFLGIKSTVRVKCVRGGYEPTYGIALLGGKATRRKLLRMPIVSKKKRDTLGRFAGHCNRRNDCSVSSKPAGILL